MCSVRHREDGFSLVEILVALFIMALASAMVVMAMPAPRDPLESEVDRFGEVISRTLDLAITRGQARGIRVEESGYRVYTRIGGRWVPSASEVLTLPSGVTMHIVTKDNGAKDELPQIVADAAGIVSGETVRIERGARVREIDPREVASRGARP